MTDVFIIGTGPAGISAAIYAVRAGVSVTAAGKDAGSLSKTDKIENYYGFPEPVSGNELYARGIAQAERLGVDIKKCEAFDVEFIYDDDCYKITTSEGVFTSSALILAAGASRRAPALKGLKEHEGRGVSYCAVCDAFFYRGQPVAVIGNGDYALNEALHLAPVASETVILTNGSDFVSDRLRLTAEQAAPAAAGAAVLPPDIVSAAGGKLRLDSRRIKEITGEPAVSSVVFEDGGVLDAAGVFVAMGSASSADLARRLGVVDGNSRLVLNDDLSSAVPGFFAAGDCTGGMLQVAKAVYDGARAGSAAARYVRGRA